MFRRRERFEIKTADQLEAMRRAGLVVASTLALVSEAVVPGVTTGELDRIAEESIRGHGAQPSFLGYHGFPASICASVNDEVVHGIPGPRTLVEGDQITIDCGAILEGWHGDAAVTVGVGEVAPAFEELSRATEDAMWAGIAAMRVGGTLNDIGRAIEASALAEPVPYGIVEDYTGHGIGTRMHMEPNVYNYEVSGRTPDLVAGMALAIEPMLTLGAAHVRTLADQWTVVTVDGSRACHWEHSVAITPEGPWVLTALDGGAARLGPSALRSVR